MSHHMSQAKRNVAIIGATGAVGEEMLSILEERKFPVGNLFLYASKNSAGEYKRFQDKNALVKVLNEEALADFDSIDLALLSAGTEVSLAIIPKIAERGTVSIDNSNAWRMDPEVPLVVPEVNTEDLVHYSRKNIVANPNCSTVQMVQVLKPIHDAFRIKRVVVATYQSTSGKGKKAMEELSRQTIALLNQSEVRIQEFPHQIAFNCIPHIDRFLENGYTLEEMKMILETKKILHAPELQVTATCVRVPVFGSHAEAVNIETEQKASAQEVRALLSQTKGVKVMDDPSQNLYPLNIATTGTDDTYVGRIREDVSIPNGINLWIVSDNLRKGAALNAVQIAEALASEFL